MQRINSAKELKSAIQRLEIEQKQQAELIQSRVELIAEGLNPMNLAMSGLKALLSSPVIVFFGIDKIRALVHQLIDRLFRKKQEPSGHDLA